MSWGSLWLISFCLLPNISIEDYSTILTTLSLMACGCFQNFAIISSAALNIFPHIQEPLIDFTPKVYIWIKRNVNISFRM